MPDRCVVAGCSNTPDAEKGIALHKIPFYGNQQSEAKARRKNGLTLKPVFQYELFFILLKFQSKHGSTVCSCNNSTSKHGVHVYLYNDNY